MQSSNSSSKQRIALASAISCTLLWAVLTIYWKALIPINSWAIIFYRVLLVPISSIIIAKIKYSWEEILEPSKDKKMMLRSFLAGILITSNWSVYIWAVNSGHVLQSSIGYYIEPLAICLFGIIFFHEKLTRYNAIAIGLATLSIVIILVHFHAIPGISLALAFTFAVYSAIKKTVNEPPLISLVYETLFLVPVAVVAIIYLEMHGMGAIGVGSTGQIGLLMLSGFLTAIPLALFAKAAQDLSLLTVGLVQYISPTISMMLGIFMFKEPIDSVLLMAFGVIWIGLGFFTYGSVAEGRKGQRP